MKRNKKINKKMWFLLVFLASFLLCVAVTTAYIQNKIKLNYTEMEHLAYTRATKVTHTVSDLLYKTQILSTLVIQNNGEIDDFERVASTIVDSPVIRNVILAPDGVVTNVFPLETNESLIGFDFFSEKEGNKEAILARETGELVLAGPFTLSQGGEAIVGRLPIYLTDESGAENFWGLVSVTLDYPDALAGAELDMLKDQGYAYEIWRINPDTNERQIIASSNYNYNKRCRYVEEPFTISNAEWIFRISPIQEWYQYPETWIFLSVGIIISILITFLFIHNYNLRQMQDELKQLSNADFLTGIMNRRGIFTILEQKVLNPSEPFALCYIDINKFKQINDTYGHHAGDVVLQCFTDCMKKHISYNDLLARIGGDEFLLIFPGTFDLALLTHILDNVQKELSNGVRVSSTLSINVHFTAGFAAFPDNGSTVDQLLETADNEMYRKKECS